MSFIFPIFLLENLNLHHIFPFLEQENDHEEAGDDGEHVGPAFFDGAAELISR